MKSSFYIFSFWAILLFGLGAPLTKARAKSPDEIDAKLKSLSLETKVGQILFFGVRGLTMDSSIENLIRDTRPGAVILFGHNIRSAKQIATLNNDLQRLSLKYTQLPLFIGVDQEGGDVVRVRTAPALPSPMSIGATGIPAIAMKFGIETGKLLKVLGFNMNLAPVLDLGSTKRKNFMSTRAFHQDPNMVAEMGKAYKRGLKKSGVMATAKHFPGHGGLVEDSHLELPKKTKTLEQLKQSDLLPFIALIDEQNDDFAMMVAHVAFPLLEPKLIPATYSQNILSRLARDDLGFKGLLMTDDLEMSGAAQFANVGERALRAFEAGNDLLMLVSSETAKRKAYTSLLLAIKSGRISVARLDQSVRRILFLKSLYAESLNMDVPSNAELLAALNNSRLKELSIEVLNQNLEKISPKTINKFRTTARAILVGTAQPKFFRDMGIKDKKRKLRLLRLNEYSPEAFNRVAELSGSSLLIFHLTGKSSLKILKGLSPRLAKNTVVVNSMAASDVPTDQSFFSTIQIHSRHSELGQELGKILFLPENEAKFSLPREATQSAVTTSPGVGG